MQEDVLLVQQALSGDKPAFCRLIQKYYKSVYVQILSLVHNPDDTEELANDVFIKAYVNLSALRQPVKFHTWLRHIAQNHSRNWLRQRDNNCLPLDDVYDETQANFVCDSAEDVLIHQEKLDKIFEAIGTLSEMDKSLMQDFYLEEMPYETLQERYKISKPAINARLIRARKRIREQLKDLFSGIVIFSWQDVLKKVLSGGVEVVKIGSKAKVILIGIAAVLVLGGTGVILWHYTTQETLNPVTSQIRQQTSISTFGKKPPLHAKHEITPSNASYLPSRESNKGQEQAIIPMEPSISKALPQVLPTTYTEKPSITESATNENGLIVEMPYGKIKFDPPYWKIEYNPTLDESKRIDEINEELKNLSIAEDKRQALLSEKELVIKAAQRPTKYISGIVIPKDANTEIPTNIDYYRIFEENFPNYK
jgi:RNA polymerase sigma factor (sigma-70 family)